MATKPRVPFGTCQTVFTVIKLQIAFPQEWMGGEQAKINIKRRAQ